MSQPPMPAEGNPGSTGPRPAALGTELGGSLPCARCGYDLKGLSVVAVCPECATPVRATLLSVVDPEASELKPLFRPRFTAWGVVAWSLGALLAALCVWTMRLSELADVSIGLSHHTLALMAVALTTLSGAGALALLRPHAGTSRREDLLGIAGVMLYVPLVILLFRTLVAHDGVISRPYAFEIPADARRTVLRIATTVVLAAILLCLRPAARTLAARSYLMRTGRVDRQTMAAMLGVLAIVLSGDVVLLASSSVAGPVEEQLRQVGRLIVLVGSTLFTLGLVGIAIDCLRLRPVLEEPPLSLQQVLGRPASARSDATHGS